MVLEACSPAGFVACAGASVVDASLGAGRFLLLSPNHCLTATLTATGLQNAQLLVVQDRSSLRPLTLEGEGVVPPRKPGQQVKHPE